MRPGSPVWEVVPDHYKRTGWAFDLTGLSIKIPEPGIVTFEEQRRRYCNREVPSRPLEVNGYNVVFVPCAKPPVC